MLAISVALSFLMGCHGSSEPEDRTGNTPTSRGPEPSEVIGEAKQPLLAYPNCATGTILSIQRTGASGTVFDGILDASDAVTKATNYGATNPILAGRVPTKLVNRYGAIRFDLSTIPSATTVNWADVTLMVTTTNSSGTVSARRIIPRTTPPTPATWLETALNYNNVFVSPGTYNYNNAAIEGSFVSPVAVGVPTSMAFTIPASTIEGWRSGTVPNYGVVLEELGGPDISFKSSEDATVADRPYMRICYTVDPCAGVVCTTGPACHQTNGTCVSGVCQYPNLANGSACSDGDNCTTDACQSGNCLGTPITCAPGDQCHNAGTCNPSDGTCLAPAPKPDNTACNDGSACTLNETCQAGACAGTAVVCPAPDQCHDAGVCNPATGTCSNPAKANGAACDDQNACTQSDSCASGVCTGGNPVVCVAQGACHDAGTCVPATGLCTNPASQQGTSCDDGSACTQTDACKTGTCTATAVTFKILASKCDSTTWDLLINHAVAETVTPTAGCNCNSAAQTVTITDPAKLALLGGCNDAFGLVQHGGSGVWLGYVKVDVTYASGPATSACIFDSASKACATRSLCEDTAQFGGASPPSPSGAGNCSATCNGGGNTTCSGGNPVQCAAPDQCHSAGSCNAGDGTCTNPALTDGTACDDGNVCTQTDACQAGVCTGTNPVTCTAADQCHDAGTCSPTTGCSNPSKTDGSSCDDNNSCTQSDSCTGGACVGSNPVVCPLPSGDAFGQCHNQGTCDPASGTCSNPEKMDGAACDDGNACTLTDACAAGQCSGFNPKVCVASDDCHVPGTCDPGSGACSSVAKSDGASCSDGNACTQTDTCQIGACVGGNPVVCAPSDDCHDAGTCNAQSGECTDPAKANGASCNDGNACTQTDTCHNGACAGGSPVACPPSDQCHVSGTCNAGTGTCSNPNKANGSACDDGNACTLVDTCQAGVCVGASPKTCTALDACHTAGTCNPASGVCSTPTKSNGSACDDSNACTRKDTCQSGTCTGTYPVICVPLNQCHDAGTCNASTGQCSNPLKSNGASCDDGNGCSQTDTCQSGSCVGSNPVVCSAADACHLVGSCSPATGTCSTPTKSDGTSCTDGDACTLSDTCQTGVCTGTPKVCASSGSCHDTGTCNPGTGDCSDPVSSNGTPCDDGNACTQNDTCQSGVCAGGSAVVCTATDQCHDAGTCDTGTGLCSNPSKSNGDACDDANPCTSTDACQSGACVGANLSDGTACTDGSACIAAGTCHSGSCTGSSPRPDGASCDDGNACTTTDTCQSGACVGASPVVCPGADQCHPASFCNTTTGQCVISNQADGTPCQDGNACTQSDTCQGGTCVGGSAVTCTASDACHDAGTCNPGTGHCDDPAKQDGVPCNDGSACTQTDTCQSGSCTGGNPVTCAPSDQCHLTGACNSVTGTCSDPVSPNGASCDDGDSSTVGDACSSGSCVGVQACDCPAGFTATVEGCQKTYDVDATHLDNLDNSCDDSIRFNDGANPYGFHWDDVGNVLGNVTRVAVQMQAGISFRTGPTPVVSLLNGSSTGTFTQPGQGLDCEAASTTLDIADISAAAYLKGSRNTLLVPIDLATFNEDGGIEGLNANPAWTGASSVFARVTVTYANECNVCTTCPAGYALENGACQTIFAVDASLLDNALPTTCLDDEFNEVASPNYTSDNASPYGFHWTDTGSLFPSTVRVDVALQSGASCRTGATVSATLNSAAAGSFEELGSCDACVTDSVPVVLSNLPVAGYVKGGLNAIAIANDPLAEHGSGLSVGPSLGGAFAQVTVGYACGACGGKADGAACEDGNVCTQGDTCQSGVCIAGGAATCVAADACHDAGTCDPASGCSNPAKADNASCDDGDSCTQTDTCQSGACVGSNPVSCVAQDDCHTAGSCDTNTGTCSNPEKNDGSGCDDSNACTQGDSCQAGVCAGSNAVNCGAAPDQCHDAGTCDPASGTCSYAELNGAFCDDSDFCTQNDVCQLGVCTGGFPVDCGYGPDQCHGAGTCDPASGSCSYAELNGASCDDGDPCTFNDTCSAGSCFGTTVTCDSGFQDQCHNQFGWCDPWSGVCQYNTFDGSWCDDADSCTQNDFCQSGSCVAGTPMDCGFAPDQCHAAGMCDPVMGMCTYAELNGAPCDDGNACTQNDTCSAGACFGGDPVVCDGDACNYAGMCDPFTGLCSSMPVDNGTWCDDGDACTYGDSCTDGVCGAPVRTLQAYINPYDVVPGPGDYNGWGYVDLEINEGLGELCATVLWNGIFDVVDDDRFHLELGASGTNGTLILDHLGADRTTCFYAPANLSAAMLHQIVQSPDSFYAEMYTVSHPNGALRGQFYSNNYVACSASDSCHVSMCEPSTGACLAETDQTDGTACSDGNGCTQTDTCQAGACTGADPVSCGSPDQCHVVGACIPETGECPTVPNGTACDDGDGNLCMTDSCQSGTCVGAPVVCGVLDQWATSASSDSEYGAGSEDGLWTAQQVIGAPDNATVGESGNPGEDLNDGHSWQPYYQNSGYVGVTVNYDTPVQATGASIVESYWSTGFVAWIVAIDTDGGEHVVWGGGEINIDQDDTPLGHKDYAGHTLHADFHGLTPYMVSGLRIMVNTYSNHFLGSWPWNAIDAVAIHGVAAPSSCQGAGVCNPLNGYCDYPAESDAPCDDGDACTTNDTCYGGVCAGFAVTCAASDACHDAGTCDPATGACSNPEKAAGAACDDANGCTDSDTCQTTYVQGQPTQVSFVFGYQPNGATLWNLFINGTPVQTVPIPGHGCYDGPVVFSFTDPAVLALLADGTNTFQVTDDAQYSGSIYYSTMRVELSYAFGSTQQACLLPYGCQGDIPCFSGSYSVAPGTLFQGQTQADSVFGCAGNGLPDGTTCSDSNGCTDGDSCLDGTCVGSSVADATPCDDGDACTEGDACQAGACSGPTLAPDGTACNDGNSCLQTDTCQGGVCSGADPVVCPGSGPCTAAACDPSTGACMTVNAPDGSNCNDGDNGTLFDVCTGGMCAGITNLCAGVVCSAVDQCHAAGSCDPYTGQCSNPAKAEGAACDDGNLCTHDDACQSGVCGGSAVVCGAAIDQWATSASATSEYDVAPNDWSAYQMIGAPNEPPSEGYDYGYSWEAADANSDPGAGIGQFVTVTVGYDTPVAATGASIVESYWSVGFVTQIEAIDVDDTAHVVWAGLDETPLYQWDYSGHTLNADFGGTTPYQVKALRITVDRDSPNHDYWDDWEAIDAVQLHGLSLPSCREAGTCNPGTGACDFPVSPDGASCDDGDRCTQTDSCLSGVCLSGDPVVCEASDQCHDVGTCDPGTGTCSNPEKAADAACDDGDACSDGDTCQILNSQSQPTAVTFTILADRAGYWNGGGTLWTLYFNDTEVATAPIPTTDFSCSGPTVVTITDPAALALLNGGCANTFKVADDVTFYAVYYHGIRVDVTYATGPAEQICLFDYYGQGCSFDAAVDTTCSQAYSGGDYAWPGLTYQNATQCDTMFACGGNGPAADGTTCNDSNGCTDGDTCLSGSCVGASVPDTTACDDGDACTQSDACVNGACAGSDPILCGTTDPCAPGVCDPATGQCSNPPATEGALCDDGDACTQREVCLGGTCTGIPVTCDADECHDAGTCDPVSGCSAFVKADGVACSDGNECTQADTCQSGVCAGGAPVVCSASDQCHVGYCDPSTGACSDPAAADGTACDDGDLCTQGDTCQNGICGGAPIVCTTDSCHDAACDPLTGQCAETQKADGDACSDGDACTQADTCQSGLCVGADPVNCPADQCHEAGVCDPATGACLATALPVGTACDDGNDCTDDTCQPTPLQATSVTFQFHAQSCAVGGGGPANTNWNVTFNGVPVQSINALGFCGCNTVQEVDVTITDPAALALLNGCNDSIALATTNPTNAWTSVNLNQLQTIISFSDGSTQTSCFDANGNCGPRNQCSGTAAITTGVPLTLSSNVCPNNGPLVCTGAPSSNGTACDDGNACTQSDTCQAGVCTGADPVACPTGDACQEFACDTATGQCSQDIVPSANGTACDDGDACTQTDTCQQGACVGGNPVVCQASDQCHDAGTCDPMSGLCSDPASADATPCNDGNACTQADSCQAGECVGSDPVDCSADDQCSPGVCNPATGQCSIQQAANGTPCDDGFACSTVDTCQNGVCSGAGVAPGGGTVDVNQTASNSTIGVTNGYYGQSFTATRTGYLTRLVVPGITYTFGASTATVYIHPGGFGPAGSGPCYPNACNPAIYNETFPFSAGTNTFVFSNPIHVIAGQQYSWRVLSGADINAVFANNNPYPGGTIQGGWGYDLLFTTYVQTCAATCSSPGAVEGAACDDGSACTLGDTCQSGACTGAPIVCSPTDQCHDAGTCDPATGVCSASPASADGTPCVDDNVCTEGDQCQAGVCTGGAPTNDGTACDDGDACTQVDACQGGVCAGGSPVTCSASDSCHTGVCNPATGACSQAVMPLGTACDDGNECTADDACQPTPMHATSVTFQFHAQSCNSNFTNANTNWNVTFNGVFVQNINALGYCGCSAVQQVDVTITNPAALSLLTGCNDSIALATTNPTNAWTSVNLNQLQTIINFSDGAMQTSCWDANGNCGPRNQCSGTAAITTGVPLTFTSNVCPNAATPACAGDSVGNGTACDDGDACTQTDACQAGVCTGGNPVSCAASDQCHVAYCDPATGQCADPAAVAAANGTSCNDGDACTQGDTCQAGACASGSPVVCAPSDACHVAGTCDSGTGTCSNPAAQNGTTCDDGNACTQLDTCQAGVCTGSNPVACTASDQCHDAGTCNTATGTCSNPAAQNGTSCVDGDACTQTDACQAGVCTGSNPVVCTASDQCHVGSCVPATGQCANPAAANGTACDDGNLCTQGDTCQGGVCAGGSAVVCAPSDQCHEAGTCAPATGCTNPPATNGTGCNDGNGCTQTDTCQSGVCTGDSPVVCPASDACHPGVCNSTTGACSNPALAAGTACDDGSDCTTDETCEVTPLHATSVTFQFHAQSCNSNSTNANTNWNVTFNGVSVQSINALGYCGCSSVQQVDVSITDPAALALLTGCNDSIALATTNPTNTWTSVALNQLKILVAFSDGATQTSCFDANGNCGPRNQCSGTAFLTTGVPLTLASNVCPNVGTLTCAGDPLGDNTACDDGDACTDPDTCQSGVCTGTPIEGCGGAQGGHGAPPADSQGPHQGPGQAASLDYQAYATLGSVAACGDMSTAISGNTAVIGQASAGVVHVLTWQESTGTWIPEAELFPSDLGLYGSFGDVVAVDGNTVLVRATEGLALDETDAVYVFVRDESGTWNEEAKLTSSERSSAGTFGRSLGVSGDTAIVGASSEDSSAGSAYVFVRDDTGTWSLEGRLFADDWTPGDLFGTSVAISADTAVVGAAGKDLFAGAAYVFVRDASGKWAQEARLVPSHTAPGSIFGASVAVSGGVVMVGAPAGGDVAPAGAVYAFERDVDTGAWRAGLPLSSLGAARGSRFGQSIALSGSTAMVGAPFDTEGGAVTTGAAHLFVRGSADGGWRSTGKLVGRGESDDAFGCSVVMSGDKAVIGVIEKQSRAGAFYQFETSTPAL